jgi:putative CRISPR-associated protein (TIGR02619 family)
MTAVLGLDQQPEAVMSTNRCVLSTVGTSLLTNLADVAGKLVLRDSANLAEAELEPMQHQSLAELSERVGTLLRRGVSATKVREAGAEFNGLYGLYNNQIDGARRDAHFLLATDTAQGRLAATLIAGHLRQCGVSHVEIVVPPGLSTRSQVAFSDGIRAVIQWCDATLPGYREAGYHVIFNLTGSFKSLQAYMNTIGMFYADEIIYIFEAPTADLIRIPRLPMRIDLALLAEQRELFALLADGLLVPPERFRNWPEALWEQDGQDSATLSAWGLLLWNRAKPELLAHRLLQLPRLRVSPAFERDFADHHNTQERIQLQEALAKVSRLLEEHQGNTAALKRDPGLQYDNYTGEHSAIGHFRVSRGLRVSCSSSTTGLVLRRFGKEEQVNARPV